MALSAAYFVGEIHIPNISGSSTSETANLLQLQIMIAKYEPLFLEKLMGADLYAAYIAGIAAAIPDTRWATLQGKIYVTNLTLSVGFSPAANYVYWHFIKNNASLTLVNAEVKAAHENFTSFTQREKLVKAWNEMVRMSELIQEYIIDNLTTYPETDISQIYVFEPINSLGI